MKEFKAQHVARYVGELSPQIEDKIGLLTFKDVGEAHKIALKVEKLAKNTTTSTNYRRSWSTVSNVSKIKENMVAKPLAISNSQEGGSNTNVPTRKPI